MATKRTNINANPTEFFLGQAIETSKETKAKIDEYVKTLLNLNNCILCKQEFSFTERIPRILVHCGHTICTSCLKNFHKNRRVRCPLCLKLVKNIETLDRLPVNHTIFKKMMEERKDEFQKVAGKNGKFSDFTKRSIPNKDKHQQVVDPLIDQYAAKGIEYKGDPNAYFPNEGFEPEGNDFKKKLAEFKKQMQLDSKTLPNTDKASNIKPELQNFMDNDDNDEDYEDYDPNDLKEKMNMPNFEDDDDEEDLVQSATSV